MTNKGSVTTIKTSLGGAIGNAIEWYDFAVFGFLAPVIANVLIHSGNHLSNLLYIYLIFAVGFISRPFGSFIFGYIGDKYGRNLTLKLTVWFMSIPTVLIGLMPSYSAIGILSPILLVICRLVQGVAMGGEFTGSVIYLSESAPAKRRSLFSSFAYISTTSGILIGSAVVTLNQHIWGYHNIVQWGWRLPFLAAIVLAIIAHYLRRKLVNLP